ncbi:hypothetical protein F0726_02292 [Acidithiobacillus caldus]|nr:hypothetical protein F0726_02292 [Acidithiobacillus caldus]
MAPHPYTHGADGLVTPRIHPLLQNINLDGRATDQKKRRP